MLRIRIGFNADPDPNPAFYLNADPNPGSLTNADPDTEGRYEGLFEKQKIINFGQYPCS